MENIKPFIKKYKFIIITLIILLIAGGVGIYLLTRPPRITIQNYNEVSSAPHSTKVHLEEFLYRFLDTHHNNIKGLDDVYIRASSYTKNEDQGLTSELFLLDIDSLKITYEVSYTWSTTIDVPDGIIINCPEISESKYPDTPCVGMYNNSEEMALRAKYPLITALPVEVNEYINNYSDYVNYKITYNKSSDNSTVTILITDITGGNYDNAIKKIASLGYDPNNYDIEYSDQSAQNYWPRVTKY